MTLFLKSFCPKNLLSGQVEAYGGGGEWFGLVQPFTVI